VDEDDRRRDADRFRGRITGRIADDDVDYQSQDVIRRFYFRPTRSRSDRTRSRAERTHAKPAENASRAQQRTAMFMSPGGKTVFR